MDNVINLLGWTLCALVASCITLFELFGTFYTPPRPGMLRKKFIAWAITFILGNGMLSLLLYLALSSVPVFRDLQPLLRGVVVGASYLVLVRQKFVTVKINGKEVPLGIEFFYDSARTFFYDRLNDSSKKALFEAARERATGSSLRDLAHEARFLIDNDPLLKEEEKKSAKGAIQYLINDSTSTYTERCVVIAAYILTGKRPSGRVESFAVREGQGRERLPSKQKNRRIVFRALESKDWSYFSEQVYPLLASRIPEDELRPKAYLEHWLREPDARFPHYFLVAESQGKAEGFVYASSKPPGFDPFVSYVVVGYGSESRSREITKGLLKEVIQRAVKDGADPNKVCLLHETSDPTAAKEPMERRQRRARFKLFAKLAEADGYDLRMIDVRYVQPSIGVDAKTGEVPLLLFVTRPKSHAPWNSMPKADAMKFIRYVYLDLYAHFYSEEAAEQEKFRQHCEDLFERVTGAMGDSVPLLDCSSYEKRLRSRAIVSP